MGRYLELTCGTLAAAVGGLALGIMLFAPINSTDPAIDAYRHYSAVEAGLSPLQIALSTVLGLLYLGVLVGSILHVAQAAKLGRQILRVSGLPLVPATIATGEGGLYVFGWPVLLCGGRKCGEPHSWGYHRSELLDSLGTSLKDHLALGGRGRGGGAWSEHRRW
jgi:hypothetical protein